jgi:hypothetical protein
MRILILVATIVLALMASACTQQQRTALQPRLPDPGYPPVLIQSSGCHNQNGSGGLTCAFQNPTGAQSRVLAVYWVDTGNAVVTNDENDSFTSGPSFFKPNTGSGIYTYSTVTQGASSNITIQPTGSGTVSDLVVLELSSGNVVGSAPNYVSITTPCGSGWTCEYGNQAEFQSGVVPISSYSILVGAQLGIYSACKEEWDPNGPQMYNDPNTPCKGWGNGFKVIYSRDGSAQTFCGSACGFTVEYATASAPVTAPFFTYNVPSESIGTTWATSEIAIQ